MRAYIYDVSDSEDGQAIYIGRRPAGVGYTQWKKRVAQVRAERPQPSEEDELIAEVERDLEEMPGDDR